MQVRRQRGAAGRRQRAGAEEGEGAAHPLGHVAGAALDRRAGGHPGRAPGGGQEPPRPLRLTGARETQTRKLSGPGLFGPGLFGPGSMISPSIAVVAPLAGRGAGDGVAAPRRTRTRRGPKKSPATDAGIRRSAARCTPARAYCRVGGAINSRPMTSVRKPGSTSSSAPTKPSKPSVAALPGGRPSTSAARNRRQPRPPSRPSSQPPATLVTITRSRVHARPISLTIATKTAISAIASATNANATMPARRIGVALPSSGAPAGHGSTQRREASPGAPNGHPPQRLPYYGKTHFARAAFPFGEGDRHLDHAKALAEGTPGQVDLEAVPL